VPAGGCSPAATTDPDPPNLGARLLGLADATWRKLRAPHALAGVGSAATAPRTPRGRTPPALLQVFDGRLAADTAWLRAGGNQSEILLRNPTATVAPGKHVGLHMGLRFEQQSLALGLTGGIAGRAS
jgi:hypothetical protein